MKNLGKRQKIVLSVLFISIAFVTTLLITKVSYSYMGANIDEKKVTEGEVSVFEDSFIFTKGNDLTLTPNISNFNTITASNLTATTNPSVKLVPNLKTNTASDTYSAGIRILTNDFVYSTESHKPEVILTVKDENNTVITTAADTGLTYNSTLGGFDITGVTGVFNIVKNHPISANTSSGTTHTWSFTITLINLEEDQSINENAKLTVEAILQKGELKSFSGYIASLRTNDGDNNLYLHDGLGDNASYEAGDNSLRYSGPSASVANYVCYGSDADTCPTENLYRVIGVFNNEVKLIKASAAISTQLGTDGAYSSSNYKWNTTNDNTWSNSKLNTINLNTNYVSYLNNINVKWTNMIDKHKWIVGGNTKTLIIETAGTQNVYNSEITTPEENTTYSDKIGLMYVSDYMYAASPEFWSHQGQSNSSNGYNLANTSNWLLLGTNEWTITRMVTELPRYAFNIASNGSVYSSNFVTRAYTVRPTFYLKNAVMYISGSGTSSDPYRIS